MTVPVWELAQERDAAVAEVERVARERDELHAEVERLRDRLLMIDALATDQARMHLVNHDPLEVTGRIQAIREECAAALAGGGS